MRTCGIGGLAYLVVGSRDPQAWARYGSEVLGGQVVQDGEEVVLRLDERVRRLVVQESAEDGVLATAWEVRGRDQWDETLSRIEDFGIKLTVSDDPVAEGRHVDRLARFTDPSGSAVELVVAPFVEPVRPFISPTGARFVTDDQGLGHITVFVENYDETVRFYTEALGFHVRDMIDSGLRATFASCNSRHHTIALIAGRTSSLDHLMLEVDDIDTVGAALDRVIRGAAVLTQNLGRHWNDHMISFYMQSPSGFQVEYGCWGRRVDPATWTEVRQGGVGGASIWGHAPTEFAPDYSAPPS